MWIRSAVEPMLARPVEQLPEAPGRWVYEPKWDGYRALAYVADDHRVTLLSRRRARLNDHFPEIVDAIARLLPPATVVDGELVYWSEQGRLEFSVLQRRNLAGSRASRLARELPCHYIVFDLLATADHDLRSRPLVDRRRALETLFAAIPASSPLALGLQTTDRDTAQAWLGTLPDLGIEGVVAKPATGRYEPGRRGWFKIKAYTTTEALVGGITGSLERPEVLLLGRHDAETSELRMVGRTSRLRDRQAEQLAGLLTPAGSDHPWPVPLPPGRAGGPFGQRRRLDYAPTHPVTVVEVRADAAVDRGRWRHPVRFLRPRPDLVPADVPPWRP